MRSAVRRGVVQGLYLALLILGLPGALVVGRLIRSAMGLYPSIYLH